MPIFPVRGLAEKGVLTDPSPYQLELNAWSRAMNMKFHANRAESAPIFRNVYSPTSHTPAFCAPRRLASTGADQLLIAYETGEAELFGADAITDVSYASLTPGTDPRSWTSAFLGDVIYLNRPDQKPWYLGPSGSAFAVLPNWAKVGSTTHTWSVRSLRAYGDYMVGLNFTIDGTAVNNLVGWSDLALAGQPPQSWDYTDSTTNAGQNPLENTTSPLVDGAVMRGIFVIYSETEVVAMQQTGTQEIFSFYTLFSDRGMISPNCVAEVLGRHYVFGTHDLYVHDGVQVQSIIDKRNYSKVFDNIDRSKKETFWVHYNPVEKTVTFAFVSADPDCKFQSTGRPNMGYVYDTVSDTGWFIDLPNVGGMAQIFSTNSLSYSGATGLTYDTIGGSYFTLEGNQLPMCAAVSQVGDHASYISANRILAYESYSNGHLSYPYLAEVNAPQFLERTGIDLDQLGADLATTKLIRAIMPLVKVSAPGDVVDIQVGASMFEGAPVVYSDQQAFDPSTNYKLDFDQAGRFLALKFTAIQPQDFGVAGFDVDMTTGGHR